MSDDNTQRVILRKKTSDAFQQSENIRWAVPDAQKRSHLKSLAALAERLNGMIDGVRFQALEQTNGQDVEVLLVAIYDQPGLLLGSDDDDPVIALFRSVKLVLDKVAASPSPAAMVSIRAGDPAHDSDTQIHATQIVADVATLARQHLPDDGCSLELSGSSKHVAPSRGTSQLIHDNQELILIGEIRRVCDASRQILLATENGSIQLGASLPQPDRHRLLMAQSLHQTVTLRVNPAYQWLSGVSKLKGGVVLEIIATLDNPAQGDLL